MLRQVALRPLRYVDEHVIGVCAGFPHPKRQTWGGSDSKRCFFGDFLCTRHCAAGAARTAELAPKGRRAGCPESRKLPAGRRTVEALALIRKRKNWIPAFAGMTSGELRAGRR